VYSKYCFRVITTLSIQTRFQSGFLNNFRHTGQVIHRALPL
jgi:hypothetical protein